MAATTDTEWDRDYFQKLDEAHLAELGYKQQLLRNLGVLHSFSLSFSVIVSIGVISCTLPKLMTLRSTVTGITTLFGYGITTGGPAAMSIGWIVVSIFSVFIGLSMAEIVSASPASGGPYFWSARLAPPQSSAFASWLTGWFNLLGQVAITSGLAFGLVGLISTVSTTIGGPFRPTSGMQLGFIASILTSWLVVNTFGRGVLRYILYVVGALNSIGVLALGIAVLVRAPTHQPASFVFGKLNDDTGLDGNPGWSVRASPAYVVCCGSLLAQFTILGYDASAHLAEETRKASRNAPIGIISSLVCSALLGFFLLLALLFSIQDFDALLNTQFNQPVMHILCELFGRKGSTIIFSMILCCVWSCGLLSMTSNSRLIFALSRDRALPSYFSKVNESLMCPVRAVLLSAFLPFCTALPLLYSIVAFSAVTSIGTVGALISYSIPISIGFIHHQRFRELKGPFNLGKASRPISLVALLYILSMVIILSLPSMTPVTIKTFNFSSIVVFVVLVLAVGSWFIARTYFEGPLRAKTTSMQFDSGNLLK